MCTFVPLTKYVSISHRIMYSNFNRKGLTTYDQNNMIGSKVSFQSLLDCRWVSKITTYNKTEY